MKTRLVAAVLLLAALGSEAQAQRTKAARETAEWLMERFGTKAGRSVPELAGRLEGVAARYGDDALLAIRKGGPSACTLVEEAGTNGAKALRVLATHGEAGATRVLSRPEAMKQYLRFGDDAAAALVRHPGVAEPLLARAGEPAVKALAAVNPQNGRRLAMVLDGELAAAAGRHPELLKVVASRGDGAMAFIWEHKAVLAGGAALTAFLADPEPFLNGTRDIASVAGNTVVKPVVGGVVEIVEVVLGVVALLIVSAALLVRKHGMPSAHSVTTVFSFFRK